MLNPTQLFLRCKVQMQIDLRSILAPIAGVVAGGAALGVSLYFAVTLAINGQKTTASASSTSTTLFPTYASTPTTFSIFTSTVTLMPTESLYSRSEQTDSSTSSSWLLHSTFPTLQTKTIPWDGSPGGGSGGNSGNATTGIMSAHYTMGYGGQLAVALNSLPRLRFVTYAFAGGGDTPGTARWEETTPSDGDVSVLKSRGGDIVVAFGGEGGCRTRTEPALRGWSAADVASAYQAMLRTYNSRFLDLDIEIGAERDRASFVTRNSALVQLANSIPNLIVSYTLPGSVDGIAGMDLLRDAVSQRVRVHTVRPMAMFWGYRVDIAEATKQLLTTARQQLNGIGMESTFLAYTPLLGADDVGNVQTIDVTQNVAEFILKNPQLKVCTVAYWELARDPDFAHAKLLLNMFAEVPSCSL